MMPCEQRCPKCGDIFIGSDAIGDPCDFCKVESIDELDLLNKLENLVYAIDCRLIEDF